MFCLPLGRVSVVFHFHRFIPLLNPLAAYAYWNVCVAPCNCCFVTRLLPSYSKYCRATLAM